MVSPSAVKLKTESLAVVGGTAGTLYGIATAGSLVGGIATGFFLAPAFSPAILFYFLAAALLLVAVAGFFTLNHTEHKTLVRNALIIGVTVLVLAYVIPGGIGSHIQSTRNTLSGPLFWNTLPGYSTLYTSEGKQTANIIYKEPSQYGDIAVFDFGDVRCYLIGGVLGSCWNAQYNTAGEYMTDLAFWLEQSVDDVKDVLLIGVGGGMFLKELNGTDYTIDAVEINPKMIEVAERFYGLPENLDYTITVDDGRLYLNQTDKKYDVIIMDICDLNSYSAHLWTKEFYALAKSKLKNPDTGVIIGSRNIVSFLGDHKIDDVISNAIGESFSNLYYISREKKAGEFDTATFIASNKNFGEFSEHEIVPIRWEFDYMVAPSTDENLDATVALARPSTEKLLLQVRENFGTDILLPVTP